LDATGGIISTTSTSTIHTFNSNGTFNVTGIAEETGPTFPTALTVNDEKNPTNITDASPDFSAVYNDPDAGDNATSYQLQLATAPDFATVIWDTGSTTMSTTSVGERSPEIMYTGPTLATSTTYYWRIKFWDLSGSEGDWSITPAYFTFVPSEVPLMETVSLDYLIVAGGGGGGNADSDDVSGGGGGGGGMLEGTLNAIPANYIVTIGSGGAGDVDDGGKGQQGGNSSAFLITAAGGGGGGSMWNEVGGQGGSGGGGGTYWGGGGSSITGQGHNGGVADGTYGGGGGGAGVAGSGRNGGNGATSSISGAAIVYAGGGGGGVGGYWLNAPGSGGTGGGATGGGMGSTAPSGTDGLGGGGGGGGATGNGGDGGDGVVIISYPTGSLTAIGGTISTTSSTTIHTFTTSGVFSIEGGTATIPYPSVSGTVQHITYTYDAVGNITSIENASETSAAATTTYQYDGLNRLIDAETVIATTSPYHQTYAYDAIGNLLNKSDQGSYFYEGSQGSNYANPYAATAIASSSLSYDNNGNLLSDGSAVYAWDYKNRLTSYGNSATTTFGYDYNGERVKKTSDGVDTIYPNKYFEVQGATTTAYIWAGNSLVAIIEGNGVSTSTEYVHPDHLGSTNVTTNELGEVTSVSDYMPYGSLRIDETDNFDPAKKFTGHELDRETDLTYAGARYYDQDIGRWISQDPASRDNPERFVKDPQQFNYYSYARNNPLGFVDPNGEDIYWYSDGTLARNTMSGNNQYFETQDISMINSNAARMSSSENYANLGAFYNLVRNGGEWDYKNNSQGREYYFFDGELVDKETFGNRHYGYTGTAGGFGETTLKAGAGYAQVKSGNARLRDIGTYFDDPKDTANIGIGISAYTSNYGSNPANPAQIAIQSTKSNPTIASLYRQVQQLQKQVNKLITQLNRSKK
jgi:RHS repeat-associated protein